MKTSKMLPAWQALWGCVVILLASLAWAQNSAAPAKNPSQSLTEIQRELIDLDKQFQTIRKDLFFPDNDEVLVYLRNRLPQGKAIDTLEIFTNGRSLYRHQYTDEEKIAFNFSNLQPVYRFKTAPGTYELSLRLTPENETDKPGIHRFFIKKVEQPKFVEVEVTLNPKTRLLAFSEKVW